MSAFDQKLFRGQREMQADKSFSSDPGDFGRGVYWTSDVHRARAYGKVVEQDVHLDNPLQLTVEQAYDLGEKEYGDLLHGETADRMTKAEAMTRDLLKKGYDGLVATHSDGHVEVVDYRPYQKTAAKKVELIKTPGFVIEVPKDRRKKFFVRPNSVLEYWAFKNRPRVFINEQIIFTFDGKPMAEAIVVKVEAPGHGEGEHKEWHKVYWKPSRFKKFRGVVAAEQIDAMDQATLFRIARDVRTRVLGDGNPAGNCERVSDAIVEEINKRFGLTGDNEAWTNLSNYRGHPHSWVVVGDWIIDATSDQFDAVREDSDPSYDIYIGRADDPETTHYAIKVADHVNEDGYWAGEGNAASGILPVCPRTGTVCLAWRSQYVMTPDCWGTIGGAVMEGRSPQQSAKIELAEETGYSGGVTLIPAFVFTDRAFSYHNFIGVCSTEFPLAPKPFSKEHIQELKKHLHPDQYYQLNPGWETDHIAWVPYEQVVKDIQENPEEYHPGMLKLFANSKDAIERALKIEPEGKTSAEKNPALEAFMKDLWAQTTSNPFNGRERVWKQDAIIEARPFDGRIHLSFIRSVERGKGQGSAALEFLISLAKKHGVSIDLDAQPAGDKVLNKSQLMAWYKRHGFTSMSGGDPSHLIYEPTKPLKLGPKMKEVPMDKGKKDAGANCPTGKRKFFDETSAIGPQKQWDKGTPNLRAYKCPLCSWWHLTSKPQWTEEQRKLHSVTGAGKYFHATAAENLNGIAEHGLLTSDAAIEKGLIEKTNWGGNLGEQSIGRIFIAPRPGAAMYYAEIVFRRALENFGSASIPLCLRFSLPKNTSVRSDVEKDQGVVREEERFVENVVIPPKDIQIWWREKWQPLTRGSWDAMTVEWSDEQGQYVGWEGEPLSDDYEEMYTDLKSVVMPKVAAGEQGHLFPSSQDAKFKAWFNGSKVVDKNGNPMPMYHGTRSSTEFDTFAVDGPPQVEDSYEGETTSSGSGADPTAFMGAHFAEETNVANGFAVGEGWQKSRYEGEAEKPRVIQVYLRITNPKDFGSEVNLHNFINQGKIDSDEVLGILCRYETEHYPWEGDDDETGEVQQKIDEFFQKYENDQSFRVKQNEFLAQSYRPLEGEDELIRDAAQELARQATHKLQQSGHDGVRYKNVVEGGNAWIAFSANQIKSAYSQFDPNDQRFTASKEAGGMQAVSIDSLPSEVKGDIASMLSEEHEYLQRAGIDPRNVYSNLMGLVDEPKVLLGKMNVEQLYRDFKRQPSEVAVKKYMAMLQKPGFEFDPILVVNGKFFDGGHRLEAYHRVGRKMIPVVDISNLANAPAENWEKWINGENVTADQMFPIRKIAAAHTPAYAQQLINTLKKTVHDADFRVIGSVGSGQESANDLDIAVDVHPNAAFEEDRSWIESSGLYGAMGLLGFEYLGPSDFSSEDSVEKSEISGKYLDPQGSSVEKFFNPNTIHTVEFWFTESGMPKEADWKSKYVLPTALTLGLGAPVVNPNTYKPTSVSTPAAKEKDIALDELVEAIRRAEGADPGLHNPGNLVGFHSGQIMEFETDEQGVHALKNALHRIADGKNPNFAPDATLAEAGSIYSGGDPNWAKNVSRILGVDMQTPFVRLIKGKAKVAAKQWAKKAAGFAFKTFKKLWHVGSMNVNDKRDGSLEGSGLSVSVNPEEWMQIAEIGGDIFELTKPGNKFLNFHRLSKEQRQQIMTWGIASGYAEEISNTWRFVYFDSEADEERYMEFTTQEEAQAQMDGQEEGGKVVPVHARGIVGTDKLGQRTKNSRGASDISIAFNLLVTVYAEDELDCDGVWWQDIYDPASLSAPRGVIFPSKIKSWKTSKAQTAAAKNPSLTQIAALRGMASGDGTIRRENGGFWVWAPFKEKDVFGVPQFEGEGIHWVNVSTIRAMESRGWIERTNAFPEEWRDVRRITEAGKLLAT